MKAADAPPMPLCDGPIWPLSVAAYHALGQAGLIPKDTELLYGVVYKKMSKSPLHSALVRRLLNLLRAIPIPGRFLSSEQPVTCDDSEPEPDIAVVRGVEEDYWQCHPSTAELVVEVCVTSAEYDRSKLRAYANAGVRECWLVLAAEEQIEVYRQPVAGAYAQCATHGPGGSVQCLAVPEFILDLDRFFKKK